MDGINIDDWVLSSKHAVTYKKGFHNEVKSSKMIYKSFGSTGLHVSLLGLGGSELAFCYGTSEEQEGINTVLEAVKSGINYIDTAPFYGHGKAEKVLGKALKNIPRDTYYLATKVGRYGPELQNMFDFSSSRVFQSVTESLDRLGIDYADVLLAHDVEFAKNTDIIAYETLPTLQKIKESGKAKYIGITGYPLCTLKEIVDKSDIKIDVILSYCRCTLFDNTLKNYAPYFKEKGIAVVNAAVLGMGLLTNDGPPEWHPVGSELKAACEQAAKYCKEREVNIAKLAVNYSFCQPSVDVHLIGMQNTKLLEMNLHSVINGLTSYEKIIQDEVSKKFFENLSASHWENKEVQSYWEKMKEINT